MTVAISGNTYPVRTELREMGGTWDKGRKAWMVPAERADEARELVGGAPRQPYTPRRQRPYRTASFGSEYGTMHYSRCNCEDYPCCGH